MLSAQNGEGYCGQYSTKGITFMIKENLINDLSVAGEKGRSEGYLFEEQVAEAINEAPYEVTATHAEQLVESAVSSCRRTKNKSDIEVSSPKMDTPIGISVKNPAKLTTSIQIQVINRRNLLAQLNTIKEVSKDVKECCNLFFGGNLEDDCRGLGIDYDLLDFESERRRDRALWDSIPLKYREAFLDYFNDSEVKKETVKTVIKKGVTTLPGAEFQLWCNSSVAGKGKVEHIVAFNIDKLIQSICENDWQPNYYNGACSGLHLGPITLQMKGSGKKRSAGYHSMQFNASLSAILLACPQAVIHKGSVSELAGLISEGKLKKKEDNLKESLTSEQECVRVSNHKKKKDLLEDHREDITMSNITSIGNKLQDGDPKPLELVPSTSLSVNDTEGNIIDDSVPTRIKTTKSTKEGLLGIIGNLPGLKALALELKGEAVQKILEGCTEEARSFAICAIIFGVYDPYIGKIRYPKNSIHMHVFGRLQAGKTAAIRAFLKLSKEIYGDAAVSTIINPSADNSLHAQLVSRVGPEICMSLKGSTVSAHKHIQGFKFWLKTRTKLEEGTHYSISDDGRINFDEEIKFTVINDESHWSARKGGKIYGEYYSTFMIDPKNHPEDWEQGASTTVLTTSATECDELLHLESQFYKGCSRVLIELECGEGYKGVEELISSGNIKDFPESGLPNIKNTEDFCEKFINEFWPKEIAAGKRRGDAGTLGILKVGNKKQIESIMDNIESRVDEGFAFVRIDTLNLTDSYFLLESKYEEAKKTNKKLMILWPYYGRNIRNLEKPKSASSSIPFLFVNEGGDGFFGDMFDPKFAEGNKFFQIIQDPNVYHTVFSCTNGKFGMGVTIDKGPWLWGIDPRTEATTEPSATQSLVGRACGYSPTPPMLYTNKSVCEKYVERCKLDKPYMASEHNSTYRGPTITLTKKETSTTRYETHLAAIPDKFNINFSEYELHMKFGKGKSLSKDEPIYKVLEELGLEPNEVHVRNAAAYESYKSGNRNEFADSLRKGYYSNYASQVEKLGYRYSSFIWDLGNLKESLSTEEWPVAESLVRQRLSLGPNDMLPKYVLTYCDTEEGKTSKNFKEVNTKPRTKDIKKQSMYQK